MTIKAYIHSETVIKTTQTPKLTTKDKLGLQLYLRKYFQENLHYVNQ